MKKTYSFKIDVETHSSLKIQAAVEKVSMAALLDKIINEYVESKQKEVKGKDKSVEDK